MALSSRTLIVAALSAATLFALPAHAADAATTDFLFSSLLMLVCGVLVMFMAAGFTMLEAGTVRSNSVGVILLKNINIYAIAGIAFYLIGFDLIFGGTGTSFMGFLGAPSLNDDVALAADVSRGHAIHAFWFFQMVFVATAASVVSGTLAERIKLWPFFLFVFLLTGIIYPVVGGWTWGGGWLADLGFSDFAGSTIVHSVGGWAALAGAMLLGARKGRFDENGRPRDMKRTSAQQVAIGVLILWFGWFGFNGGSQLSFSSIEDAVAVSKIFVNTNAAAAGGVIAVMAATQLLYRRPDLMLTMNGALAGLVAITAEPLAPSVGVSVLIGMSGGLVMMATSALLDKAQIDDVVGAVPVHLGAGIWGTLVAGLTGSGTSLTTQLIGVAVIGVFVFVTSYAVWFLLKRTCGIRLHAADEEVGADISEIGISVHNSWT